MKKKMLVIAAVVICLSVLAAGTLAYFTDEATAHNVITSNGIDIAIEEWQLDGEDLVPYPEDPIEFMPGETVSKIVTVKNFDADSWIRASIQIVVKDAEGNVMELAPETIEKIITLTMGEDWTAKDGWYYYNTSVAKNKATTPLFTEVVSDGPNMTNEYQNCTVEVIVDAQAVQIANNGETALEAAGWPAA